MINSHDSQICWACKKSINGGCSWSKELRPIKGWNAELVILGDGVTYKIMQCPEFEKDNACESCLHYKRDVINCIGCLYKTENGKNSKIKWEERPPTIHVRRRDI